MDGSQALKDPVGPQPGVETPVVEVPTVAFSLVIGLTDRAQVTFQSGFACDESDLVVNERLDRIGRFAERQRAIHEQPEVEAELRKHRDTLAQMAEDRARLDVEYDEVMALRRKELAEAEAGKGDFIAKAKAEIGVQILELQEARQGEFNKGLEEHRRGGRQGSYRPQGARAANLDRIDLAIDMAKRDMEKRAEELAADYDDRLDTRREEIHKAEAEHEQAHQHYAISLKRYTEAIAEREGRLVELQALIGG